MADIMTRPGEVIGVPDVVECPVLSSRSSSSLSLLAPFEMVKALLSDRKLRRSRRSLTNERLLRLAGQPQSPGYWHEGQEEKPF